MPVLLLGPDGAGKSTLAPLVARAIGYSFLDLEHDARLCDTNLNPLLKALLGPDARDTLMQSVIEAEFGASRVVLTLNHEQVALCTMEVLARVRALVLAPARSMECDPEAIAHPAILATLPVLKVPAGETPAETAGRITKWWKTGED